MTKTPLARLLDRDALDASTGARARLRIDVPAAWLTEGALVEVTAPARLPCAACAGGGCDACARSGAFRAPDAPADRVLRVGLPGAPGQRGLDPQATIAIRIVRPFGPGSAIEHLVLELGAGSGPSACVRRLAAPLARRPSEAALPWRAVVAAALGILIAVLLAGLLGR